MISPNHLKCLENFRWRNKYKYEICNLWVEGKRNLLEEKEVSSQGYIESL